jgi:cyanophycinase
LSENRFRTVLLIFLASCFSSSAISQEPKPAGTKFQYFRVGSGEDKTTRPRFGIAMMGGGSDLDAAFLWLCQRANGGDLLVLRATGTDAYNPYIKDLKGCSLNSVATLVIPDTEAARDPQVREKIAAAEAIFISGGDQSNYIKYWQNTPVQSAINQRIKSGVPIGGTSAGLAVLTDFVFTAMNDSAYSKDVLKDPFDKTVTISRGFLDVPALKGTISDQHFAKRDRFGRFTVFLARILQDGMTHSIKGIAVDERNALLVDKNNRATLVGDGYAYFVTPPGKAETCKVKEPLLYRDIAVYKINNTGAFDITKWQGAGGISYKVTAHDGVLSPNAPAASIY